VRVLRKGIFFDRGKIEDRVEGHAGDVRYLFGLYKIIDSVQRNQEPITGYLEPSWFKEGDVIRIQVAPSDFRSSVRFLPELWKTPTYPRNS